MIESCPMTGEHWSRDRGLLTEVKPVGRSIWIPAARMGQFDNYHLSRKKILPANGKRGAPLYSFLAMKKT
jgi:hypothetical protein